MGTAFWVNKNMGSGKMKQLICEMCGSAELMKQDGLFVCQACGTKYSVEEAKKMMIEGAVEVQGAVQIKNTAQLENLLKLARSSYASKNYSQAEEFCNQIIAMDAEIYEAWKLKGEAINFQITGSNDRITEVYNCIMTSYKVLDAEGKDAHREEVLKSLRACLEGEIDFALKLFKSNRPSDDMLSKVKNTFIQCASNVITSYEELGYTEAEADEYRTYIKNYFIEQVNIVCDKTWDDVVYHNYYRNGWNDDYHPSAEIMRTYISEGDNLIELLCFAEEYFTDATPLAQKRENYKLRNYFQRKLIGATSFKRMVRTTTNGYGAVTSRREYWEVDKKLSNAAQNARNDDVTRTCALYDKVESEMAKSDPATRDRMLAEWKKQLNAIDTSYRFPGAWIFVIILFGALAYGSFAIAPAWFSGFEWFGTVFGILFAIFAVGAVVIGHAKAITEKSENEAKADRLVRKIKEIS